MWLAASVLVLALWTTQVQCRTRTYYIAAVEEDWDYAPRGNCVSDDTTSSDKFIKHGTDRIGSVYRKILYRQYKDATFSRQVTTPPEQGMLGPTLRAETGDTIEVVFKNLAMTANRSLSMHPHGAQYFKNEEGALYADQTTGSDKADDGVPPGQTFRYRWRLPSSFAPTRDDDACLPWVYHSHVSAAKDVDSGLVGLLLTCKKGSLLRWGRRKDERKDVLKEYPIYLDTTDENNSWLTQHNLNKCGNPASCTALSASADSGFLSSNRMSHVNGRVYGNLEGLDAVKSSRPTAFYFFSVNRGVTSVHFSGQVLTVNRHSVDSISLFPATFVSALMYPSGTGYWLLASRNVDTYTAGQQAYLRVRRWYTSFWGRKRRNAISTATDNPTNLDQAMGPGAANLNLTMDAYSLNMDLAMDPELQGAAAEYVSARGLAKSGRRWWPRRRARRFYLGVEDYVWDYGPSGQNLYSGGSLTQPGSTSATYFERGPHRIGGLYKKTRYVQFNDSSFSSRQPRDEAEVHLGMLGPVLMAEVGEWVEVHLKNMANRPYSFLPHGVLFSKDNEGFVYRNPETNQMDGLTVSPGETATYRFKVPPLGLDDLPCVTRSYHSAVDPVRDINTGLVGPMVLCRRGQLDRNPKLPWYRRFISGRPSSRQWFKNHQHFFLNFFTLDENLSWHLQDNINTYTTDPTGVDINDAGFRGANRKHGINGRMFGNLEGLSVCLGDQVAWHLFGVGGQFDMHGVNFQGQTLEVTGNHVNAKVVIPGTALTMTSSPDTVGNWSVSCRTNFHFLTGMTAKYEVKACEGMEPEPWQQVGVTRRYFVAAQELVWDYVPLKRDPVTGENFTNDSQPGYLYVKDTPEFIGSSYKKARYLEYTDAAFTTLKPRPPHQEHLGILGPVIEAEVGDVIEVVFFNNASRPYSIHPQGVRYDKANEGANYQDGSPSAGDSVPPGTTFTYTWQVPERAGPGKNDPSCVAWMYYSSVNSVKDMNSGLVGPLLVCEPHTLTNNVQNLADSRSGTASRNDVDREFWMLYFVFDENLSWYLQDNVQERAPQRTNLKDPDFQQSNHMNAINGLVYGNVPGMVMQDGDVVSWYLLGLGSSFDYHPVHFHGQTFTHRRDRTHRGDVLEVFPSTSSTVEMVCDNPGIWLVHCHFSDHVTGGMEAVYTILPAGP